MFHSFNVGCFIPIPFNRIDLIAEQSSTTANYPQQAIIHNKQNGVLNHKYFATNLYAYFML